MNLRKDHYRERPLRASYRAPFTRGSAAPVEFVVPRGGPALPPWEGLPGTALGSRAVGRGRQRKSGKPRQMSVRPPRARTPTFSFGTTFFVCMATCGSSVSEERYKRDYSRQLLTVDPSARASMKNAASCET